VAHPARIVSSFGTDANPANNTAAASLQLGPSLLFDLQLDASADQATVNQGDLVTFTYTLTNHGPDVARSRLDDYSGLYVLNPLPPGFHYLDGVVGSARVEHGSLNVRPGGQLYLSNNGNLWTLLRRPVYPGPDSTITLFLTALAATAGPQTGHARLAYLRNAISDPFETVISPFASTADNPANNEAYVTVDVLPDNQPYDLHLAIAQFDYYLSIISMISVINPGPGVASDVVVEAPIPDGLIPILTTVYGSGNAHVTYDAGTRRWSVPFVLPGDTLYLRHYYYKRPGTFTKTATLIGGLHAGDDPSNNTDSALLTVPPAAVTYDLQLQQTVDRTDVLVGETVTFTFTATNNGPETVDDVEIRNTLFPQSIRLLPEPFAQISSRSLGVGQLVPGQAVSRTLVAEAATPGTYTNTALLFSQAAGDTTAHNDTSSVRVTIRLPGSLPPVAADDAATTTENMPVVIDVLANDADPDGMLDPATVAVTGGPADGAATVNPDGTITYTPAPGFTGVDAFTYTVADDSGGRSNEATVSITVDAAPTGYDLSLTKTANPSSVPPSGEATFLITVTNSGPQTATGVEVTDPLPGFGFTLQETDTSQGSYSNGTGRWTVGDLAPGQSATLEITGLFHIDQTNTATITGGLDEDTNPNNNTDSATVTVSG
jgi:uncharacterized repeat protein (TIGR01451 family)